MNPRILVIRGGAIGDFILTLPALKLLRENFPAAHLEIIGYKHIVEIAHGRYYADGIRSIEYAAMSPFFIPNGDLPADLAGYFASFQQVVSYLYDPDGFFGTNLKRAGVKHLLEAYRRPDDSQHAACQLARPLEQLALFLEDPAATLHPADEDQKFATAFLGGRRNVIALHPGSGSDRKNWPLEYWVELVRLLHGQSQELLLLGGEADLHQLSVIRRTCPAALLAQDLPLPHVAALLQQSRLFIGHDSGISHIAAAAGAASILMFGPTDPDVWAPANTHVTVLRAPAGDLAQLSAAHVFTAILQKLQLARLG